MCFFCFSCFCERKTFASGFRGSVQRAMVKHGNQQKMQPMSATEKRLRAAEAAAVGQFVSKATKASRVYLQHRVTS